MKNSWKRLSLSCAGTAHIEKGVNNQDAGGDAASQNAIILAVFDGCGSGAESEVGSRIGKRIFVRSLQAELEGALEGSPDMTEVEHAEVVQQALSRAQDETLKKIGKIAEHISDDFARGAGFERVIGEMFLFTTVGAIVTDSFVHVFAGGDGAFGFNGEIIPLTTLVKDTPPYMGYKLLRSPPTSLGSFEIRIVSSQRVSNVQSVFVSTDGVMKAECRSPKRESSAATIVQKLLLASTKTPTQVVRTLFTRNTLPVSMVHNAQREALPFKMGAGFTDDLTLCMLVKDNTAPVS